MGARSGEVRQVRNLRCWSRPDPRELVLLTSSLHSSQHGVHLFSVKAFATRCRDSLTRLDVLVQNAGVGSWQWTTTKDGYETVLQVNVLATGLLGVLLVPVLAKTANLPLEDGMQPFRPHQAILGSGGKSAYTRPTPW